MIKKMIFLTFIICVFSQQVLFASEMRGAKYLINELNKKSVEKNANTPIEKLKNDLTNYKSQLSDLPNEQVIEQWLSLYNRIWELNTSQQPFSFQGTPKSAILKDLLETIPPPKAWKLLSDKIGQIKSTKEISDIYLTYIASFLNKDSNGMIDALKKMELLIESLPPNYKKTNIKKTITLTAHTLNTIVGSIDDQIKGFLNAQLVNTHGLILLNVPDLVTMVGSEQAKIYLQDALLRENVMLEVEIGDETRNLTRNMALELIDKLKTPQWKLAASVDAIKLYEALQKKFSLNKSINSTLPEGEIVTGEFTLDSQEDESFGTAGYFKREAQIYYMMGLIITGRKDEAKKIASNIGFNNDAYFSHSIIKSLITNGYGNELQAFLFELLKENPEYNLWDYYIPLATATGNNDKMIALLKQSMNQNKQKRTSQIRLKKYLFKAFISINKLDQASHIVNEINYNKDDLNSLEYTSFLNEIAAIGESLTKTGHLLENKEWIDKGIEFLQIVENNNKGKKDRFFSPENKLANALIELKRYSEAEKVLIDSILDNIPDSQNKSFMFSNFMENCTINDLVYVYHKSGQYQDIVTLIEEYPHWNKSDLNELITKKYSGKENLGYMLANALYHQGKKSEAVSAAKHVIKVNSGHDPSYELLVNSLGAAIIPWLDEAYLRDPFEERPLVWKAVLLLKDNKYDEAEAMVKQAIVIDPTDGEQPFGRRLKAYSVMADIQEAKGNVEKRNFYRNIVKAVQLSEKADKFYAAGFIKTSADLYSESLEIFADAYCIQGRLAMRLEELGKLEEAEKYYLKTFELMPNSFGRMENYCFGCESIFGTKLRQNLANRAFTSYKEQHPEKPQAYYMLGILKQEQGKIKEAYNFFNKAVKLDPLYINAWKKLKEISGSFYLPLEDRENITLTLLKLDPYSRHTSPELDKIWDLNAMWTILATVENKQDEEIKNIYPLAAAKKTLEDSQEKFGDVFNREINYFRLNQEVKSSDPGKIFSQHDLIQNIYSLIE